ncbi:MAG: hypothetical protein NVSMB5_13230 [Candidatus Velthaea sp.]
MRHERRHHSERDRKYGVPEQGQHPYRVTFATPDRMTVAGLCVNLTQPLAVDEHVARLPVDGSDLR